MEKVASQNAPSVYVVIPHFIIGGMFWFIAVVLLSLSPEMLLGHYFNNKLLAVTHLIIFGWINMIIFGTLYQLLPVILEVKIFSEKLAMLSLGSLTIGAILLPIAFWNFWLNVFMHIAIGFLLFSVTIFSINVFFTENSKKSNIEKLFIRTSTLWLLFTVIVGTMLAINLTHPYLPVSHIELLKLHAHAGIIGWFFQLVMGVGSKLFPMFLVSHQVDRKNIKGSYYFTNIGLVLLIISLYFQAQWGIVVSAFIVMLGVFQYLTFLFKTYHRRVKRKLDTPMKQSMIAFLWFLLIPLILLIIWILKNTSSELITPISIVYGSVWLVGFFSSLIMGQTFKILPFIVWLEIYKNRKDKEKMIYPKDLYYDHWFRWQLWFFNIGMMIILAGILVQKKMLIPIGGSGLIVASILYNLNMLRVIFYEKLKI